MSAVLCCCWGYQVLTRVKVLANPRGLRFEVSSLLSVIDPSLRDRYGELIAVGMALL